MKLTSQIFLLIALLAIFFGGLKLVRSLDFYKSPNMSPPSPQISIIPGENMVYFETIELPTIDQTGEANLVIRSQKDFDALLDKIQNKDLIDYDVPQIDFSTEMVIAVLSGMKSSGGYSVKIQGIEETATNLIVHSEETSPGSTCVVPEALTYPQHIIKLAKSTKKVTFETTGKIHECE
jgi:hypothetical protein